MGAGKTVGSILAIAAGVMILIGVIIWFIKFSGEITNPTILTNIILSALTIVGGILGLIGKMTKVGGVLALISGVLWVIGGLLMYAYITDLLMPAGLLLMFTLEMIFYFFSIESVMAIIGGILLLVSPSD